MPPLRPAASGSERGPGDSEPDAAAMEAQSELSRREFLYLGGAALLSHEAVACTRAPAEKIVPYRVQPPGIVPGQALHYASASTLDGYARGILVLSREGRPVKVEGNPAHPASLGATSALEQALLLELYDSRRLRSVARGDTLASEADLAHLLRNAADLEKRGRGVHVVLPALSSPLLASQLRRLRERLPELTLHFHVPLSRSAVWRGARLAFGATVETRVDLKKAAVIAAIGADFLGQGPDQLAHARAFSDGRRMRSASDPMNRLYVVETAMSVTGGMADHRLPLRPSQLLPFAAALLREIVLAKGPDAHAIPADLTTSLAPHSAALSAHARFIRALARDLVLEPGRGVVMVGDHLPPEVHAAAHAMNAVLASSAVSYGACPIFDCENESFASLQALHEALASNDVQSLILFDTDVVYASAAGLDLRRLLRRAKESIYFGLRSNETAAACDMRAPALHVLESWSDARSLDGTTSLVQPLIAPLYGGRTPSQVLAALLGAPRPSAHDLLREFWRSEHPEQFTAFWETTLAEGTVEGSATPALTNLRLSWGWLSQLAKPARESNAIELNLVADTRLHDGRFADNPWLLELPCPVTKQTWGNAAWLAPSLAREHQITNGDVLELTTNDGRSLKVPALLVAGHAPGAVTLALGWGQKRAEAQPVGVNAYHLLSQEPGEGAWVRVHRTSLHEALALTQDTTNLGEGSDSIVLWATLAEHRANPKKNAARRKTPLSMYSPDAPEAPRQWGMTIDLNACTGCSACVIACQAENNVPSVGKSGVLKRREMHWLRIDRYVAHTEGTPRVLVQPMACQHCEKAPCEYVCPTAATVHSSDGLNQMIYNRCVGTRFCSNNCPYKVRRFNWFDYHHSEQPPRELAENPEVTVRARGVMEKCTYCVQRIRNAEIRAKVEQRPLADEHIQTACEQACPTQAIRFGDINDPRSEVAALRQNERAFQVLQELGAVPRTRYLMKLSNPNPELT